MAASTSTLQETLWGCQECSPGCTISSTVWIGADSESVLSVSNGRLSPIETDKTDSLSDTLHTSAYRIAGTELPDSPSLDEK